MEKKNQNPTLNEAIATHPGLAMATVAKPTVGHQAAQPWDGDLGPGDEEEPKKGCGRVMLVFEGLGACCMVVSAELRAVRAPD